MTSPLPKIYCFVNSGVGTDWQNVLAMAEDGTCLAEHISSSKGFAKHDIGWTSDWQHEHYGKHYPDGYELEWVDSPKDHEGLLHAYALNQERKRTLDEAIRDGGTVDF